MQSISVLLRRLGVVVIIALIGWALVANYSYVFAKTVKGEVLEVERVSQPGAIIAGRNVSPDVMFSFAVMIRNVDNEIYSSSSEDRQWAVVRKGHCVEAKFYPYPPWDLAAANTYFNARLVKVYDCPGAQAKLGTGTGGPVPPPEVATPAPLPAAPQAPLPTATP